MTFWRYGEAVQPPVPLFNPEGHVTLKRDAVPFDVFASFASVVDLVLGQEAMKPLHHAVHYEPAPAVGVV